MFLANQTRPDIAFSVNLLAQRSSQPTIWHWNGIERVFCYLLGTADYGLYYPANSELNLRGYADAGYLSDTSDEKLQTGYIFLIGPTAFSWRSTKQTLTTTLSNHSEIIALYEASQECIWLRNIVSHIAENTGKSTELLPTIIYEDNKPCVDQIQTGFIKRDKTKHIAPKFFFAHEQHGKEIDVKWIPSKDNVENILIEPLPPNIYILLTHAIGLQS
jgi:hypothetical protein